MHYVLTVVVDRRIVAQGEAAVRAEVARLMAPYNENREVEPHKIYLTDTEIAEMVAAYGPDRSVICANMSDWYSGSGGEDRDGVYYMSRYPKETYWDWWRIGGRWDGRIKSLAQLEAPPGIDIGEYSYSDDWESLERNMVPIRQLPEDWTGYAVLLPDGTWHEEQRPYNQGVPFEPRDVYDAAAKRCEDEWSGLSARLLGQYAADYAVAVDYHS